MFALIPGSKKIYINANYLLMLVMGAVLLPLQRVSRFHHLANAEGIQLKKILSLKKVTTHHLLVLVIGGGGGSSPDLIP